MRKITLFVFFLSLLFSKLYAFPTSLFWTSCITDVVPVENALVGVADYFTVFSRHRRPQILPPDIGLTVGTFKCGKLAGEAGFDYLAGLNNPWFFNAKVRLEEYAFARQSPSFSIGIYDVGTSGRTNFNVVDVVFGKTLIDKSRVFVGGYVGSSRIGPDRGGFMFGYLKGFCPMEDCEGTKFDKWTLMADYAFGRNAIGGGGVGLLYSLSPYASILFGPTWFNYARINGTWKWTVQAFYLIPIKPTGCCRSLKKEKEAKAAEAAKKKEAQEKQLEPRKTKHAPSPSYSEVRMDTKPEQSKKPSSSIPQGTQGN